MLDEGEETVYGQNLTTSLLSEPLSLGNLLLPVLSRSELERDTDGGNVSQTTAKQRQSFNICSLGVRKETCPPTAYWREVLLVAMKNLGWTHVDLTLDFIGPEVVRQPTVTHFCPIAQSSFTLRWLYKGRFHDFLANVEQTAMDRRCDPQGQTATTDSAVGVTYWDAFALFNPGIGHDNLKMDWKPTLDILLSSARPRIPLLLTAYSWVDSERDCIMLSQYQAFEGTGYQRNPWSSRIAYQDRLDVDLVKSNFCYHVISQTKSFA